ncbi:MAG: FkbM family methyltransferase [Candidatus Paceibacterota bacterium]
MKRLIKNAIVGRQWSQRFFTKLLGISLEGLNMVGAGRGPQTWGEAWAIKYVLSKSRANPVVFDAGAQGGDYMNEILNISPTCTIYAFEPAKRAFIKLQEIFQNHPNINLINIALGAENTTTPLFSSEGVDGVDSLYKLPDTKANHFVVSREVHVSTINGFCKDRGISYIDLLKLDIEGGELAALKGAETMIKEETISFIQFEHSNASFYAGYRFKEIFDLLSPHYRIYRILRHGLTKILEPSALQDLPFAVNYLAESRKIKERL